MTPTLTPSSADLAESPAATGYAERATTTVPQAPISQDASQVIRSHLANERTFLAWVRTSVSIIALGLAAAAFLGEAPGRTDLLLAVATILVGLCMLVIGFRRYAGTTRQIEGTEDLGAAAALPIGPVLLLGAMGIIALLYAITA